jgi:iron complex transport system substrate-binding protein
VFKRSLALAAALAATAGLAFSGSARSSQPGPFPVTVTAANGKVTIRKQPERIVSLSPTATEDLFSIGAGEQVVAVDDQSDYPKRAPRTKLSGLTPNAEAIAKLRPNLVVVQFDANKIVEALGKLRIAVLVQPSANTFGEAYAQIRQLGLATGHRKGAANLVKKMKTKIAALVASIPKPTKQLSVYHELTPDYYSATSKTFIGRVYALFGLKDIADAADSSGTRYPQLSSEYILSADPDLVVLADTRCCAQSRATVAARPGWSTMTAVRRGAVLTVDDSIASRWGPRVVDFVRAVARALRTVGR